MSSSPTTLTISDPHRTKHPFLVASPDGYWHCATCRLQPGNERHRRSVGGMTYVIVDDAENTTKWIEVPLSLVLACHNADQLAEAVRAQLPPLRAAA